MDRSDQSRMEQQTGREGMAGSQPGQQGREDQLGRQRQGEQGMSESIYRQRGGEMRYQRSERSGQGSGPEWGFVIAGAGLLALGGYMLLQGARGEPVRMPFMGDSEGGMGERARHMGERMRRRGERMAEGMLKGDRDQPGVIVRESITVQKPLPEVFRFWRNLENLPRVMNHLEEVRQTGDRRSHWVAKGPAGTRVEWNAEITDARENELLAWRSLEGSEVPNEGSVRFSRTPDGQGTMIDVSLTYHPPGGAAGAMFAKLFGREPAQEIKHDLNRFKERVESGQISI